MPHKLTILSRQAEEYRAVLESSHLPDLIMVETAGHETEILLGEPDLVRSVMDEAPNLRWVQSIWAGVDPLLDPSIRRDYLLTNARGVFGNLMSEYVLCYILAHERRLLERWNAQRSQIWDDSRTGFLRGKTIGLLGVGSIGAEIARTASFFGMQVRGYTRASENCEYVDRYFHGEDLVEFAKGIDYLVSVLPATVETLRIVDSTILAALPTNALLINVGRGSTLDETALIRALSKKHIAGAILDVTDLEPLPTDHPFWTAPNLLLTFHTSAPSLVEDITKLFIENYSLYLAGQPLKYQVEFEKGY